jgi:hypothetical protein
MFSVMLSNVMYKGHLKGREREKNEERKEK